MNPAQRYEEIMGLVDDPSWDSKTRMDKAVQSLSGRLQGFRKWLSEDAKATIHPALCIVNGEATDGTRNAPLLTVGLPAEDEKSVGEGPGESPLGRVDGRGDQSLYDKNIGCQIRTTREIKQDDTMMVIPRTSMVTPDLVASSDAGRAILACCEASTESNGETGFWDAFADTAEQEDKLTPVTSTGPQCLMKILQERKKVEATVSQRKTGDSIELAQFGSITRRAPVLAFLIHQRFSNHHRPIVSSPYLESLDTSKPDNGESALANAKLIHKTPEAPDSFAPYVRTLPSAIPMPMCWKRSELALLTGCMPGRAILQDAVAQTSLLVAEFTTLVRAGVLERFPDVFPPGLLTWDRWVWAASIFASRVLPVGCYLNANDAGPESFQPSDSIEFQSPPAVWEELGVLIPFLDMLNHEIDAHQVTFKPCVPDSPDYANGEAPHPPKAIFHKKVKKGSEVFTAYGKLNNRSMIVRYGMAQMNNFYDEIKIGLAFNEAVGNVPTPPDYVPVVEKSSCVFEADADATDKWWTDYRLGLLHREAGVGLETLLHMKQKEGSKLTAVAYNDGAYHPTIISAGLVATLPDTSIKRYLESPSMSITQDHLNTFRNFLANFLRQKLEKLLANIESGLKAHYSDLNLWKKASEGGIRYLPPEGSDGACIGWQTFFDKHAYHASMEVEKHYYAMGPDSCTLTLYDSQLRTLQTSWEGIVDDGKFETGVKQQLEELGYTIVEEEKSNDESVDKGSGSSKPGSPDKKASPGRKKRNKKKNAGGTANGAAGSSSAGEKPPALKLHVGNLSYATTPSDLYDYFSSLYGKEHVLECHIPIERASRRSRGFGFVTMPQSIAEKVLVSNQKHEIDGRLLKVAKSNSAGTSDTSRSLPGPAPVSGDRCAKCGYRPKYCECNTPRGGGWPGPLPPPDPPRGRESPGYPDPARPPSPERMRDDYHRYDRDRDRDRYRDDHYRRREYDREYDRYDREYDRDYYDRDYDMDRDRYRYREGSPRYMEYDRDERRSRSERSRERRRDRSRDRSRDSRSPSRRREEERRRDRDRERERRPVEDNEWDRDRKRSRSRSRERSRKKKSKKRES